jgi:hypothetical protein
MEITTQLDPKYTEKIASIQRQTQQDLSEIIGRAIDLYCQTLEMSTPNALELFQSAGLVGCIDTDPSVPYQSVIQEYLEQKQAQNQG